MTWPLVPLGDLGADVPNACVGGPFGSDLTTRDYVDSGVPVIRGGNLAEHGFVDEGFVFVSDAKAESLRQNQARPGDIAFTQRGTIGQVALVPERTRFPQYVISQSQMKLTPDLRRVDPRFLVHYFKSPLALAHLHSNTLATGVPHINLTILRRVPVPVPPLPEQRHIADILDKADTIRRKRKEAIALTEELLRSAFLEMFGDPVTNPKGWPVKPLGEVSDVAGGLQVTSARASNPLSMPYLRVANVYRDQLDLSVVKDIRVTEAERVRATLRRGDVLVVEGHGNPEELGRSAVWREEIVGCTHQNHLIRVRASAGVLNATFLSAFLNSSSGKKQMIARGKTTSGLNTISTSNVRSVQILVPPLRHQAEYAELVSRIATLEGAMQRRSDADENLFNSLVARAFSGGLSS